MTLESEIKIVEQMADAYEPLLRQICQIPVTKKPEYLNTLPLEKGGEILRCKENSPATLKL